MMIVVPNTIPRRYRIEIVQKNPLVNLNMAEVCLCVSGILFIATAAVISLWMNVKSMMLMWVYDGRMILVVTFVMDL